jgi:hypothetical protein
MMNRHQTCGPEPRWVESLSWTRGAAGGPSECLELLKCAVHRDSVVFGDSLAPLWAAGISHFEDRNAAAVARPAQVGLCRAECFAAVRKGSSNRRELLRFAELLPVHSAGMKDNKRGPYSERAPEA